MMNGHKSLIRNGEDTNSGGGGSIDLAMNNALSSANDCYFRCTCPPEKMNSEGVCANMEKRRVLQQQSEIEHLQTILSEVIAQRNALMCEVEQLKLQAVAGELSQIDKPKDGGSFIRESFNYSRRTGSATFSNNNNDEDNNGKELIIGSRRRLPSIRVHEPPAVYSNSSIMANDVNDVGMESGASSSSLTNLNHDGGNREGSMGGGSGNDELDQCFGYLEPEIEFSLICQDLIGLSVDDDSKLSTVEAVNMFAAAIEEDALELTEAVLACDLRRKVYNSDGLLTDPYAHYLCRSRGYVLCRSTYSSSEMTRLSSSSSSSSSASSSPVLFTTAAQSQNNNNSNGSSQGSLGHHHHHHQFHHHGRRQQQHVDSVEENGDPTIVERRYGGPPARDAALVIQRAYRRYSMVKEFQRIKTERRLSRRINNNAAIPAGSNACSICIDLHEPHSSHPTSAEVDGLEDEFEDASITSSCNELPPMPISDCAEVTEVDVEVDHAILSSSSSGHHHHHHSHHSGAPGVTTDDVSSTSTAVHGHHNQHYHQQQQHHFHQQHHSNSSRLQQQLPSHQHHQQLHYASNSVVGQISSNSSSSRLAHHHPQQAQQRHFSSQQQQPHHAPPHHPHSHHHHHIPSSQSQTQLSQQHQPKHVIHHQSSSGNISGPNLVVTSSSGPPPPSAVHQVSPNISSSSVSSQNSPAQDKQRTPKSNLSDGEAEILRKRLYRVGLNLFNKKPEVGIAYLVKKKFLEGSPPHVARFLISRKGLSKQMIGEYLANLQSPFSMSCLEHFASEIDLASMPVDLALRKFQTFLRMPGEAQKIERIMESFSRRYATCNPQLVSQFRNGADTVFVLAFAIVMLNTDLHTPHLKQDRRMKMEDFVKNLRGIDDGGDIDREILVGIYERIKLTEFKTGSDHVTQVMKVQQTIVGKKPNLALPHRRLVCYCRLYEVSDVNKREKAGSHQREVFLFNDILVLTKIFHKKRNSVTYSFRQNYPLSGITLSMFSNQYFEHGLALKNGDTVLLNLNARNEHDRAKFTEDLREAIAESDEMARIESISKENRDRDSGVDVGKIKRFSNSLLDISDQCMSPSKPIRRGSCGSLDSGMSVSFHSDEIHQQQQHHQPPLAASNSNGGGNNATSQTALSQSNSSHHSSSASQSHYPHPHHHQQTSSSNCSATSSQLSHS